MAADNHAVPSRLAPAVDCGPREQAATTEETMKRNFLLLTLALCVLTAPAARAGSSTTTTGSKTTGARSTGTKTTMASSNTSVPSSGSQSDLGLKRIGGAIGFVSPENLDGVFSIGAFADWGTITPNIGLESRLDYWSWSESAFGVESSVHDVTLGARGKYYFDVANPRIRPFAGAGLALHFIGAKVDIPAQGSFPAMTAEDSQTKLGLDLGGGIVAPMGPRTDFLGELWYGVVSDVSQFSLRAGLSWKLGS
jgi:opacity protein-like surface antigen